MLVLTDSGHTDTLVAIQQKGESSVDTQLTIREVEVPKDDGRRSGPSLSSDSEEIGTTKNKQHGDSAKELLDNQSPQKKRVADALSSGGDYGFSTAT
mgnify:CR=1 FL=1